MDALTAFFYLSCYSKKILFIFKYESICGDGFQTCFFWGIHIMEYVLIMHNYNFILKFDAYAWILAQHSWEKELVYIVTVVKLLYLGWVF